MDELKVHYFIIKYYLKTFQQVEKFFDGTSEEEDEISSEEIVAEIYGDVTRSIDFWTKEKGFAYISKDEITRSDVEYVEINLLPTSFVYLVPEDLAHPWKKKR